MKQEAIEFKRVHHKVAHAFFSTNAQQFCMSRLLKNNFWDWETYWLLLLTQALFNTG